MRFMSITKIALSVILKSSVLPALSSHPGRAPLYPALQPEKALSAAVAPTPASACVWA
jgi:hypothetical protein